MDASRRRGIIIGIVVAALVGAMFLGDKLHQRDVEARPPPTQARQQPEELARSLGIDAEAFAPVPVDPAPPAGNLTEEAARFVSIDACVEERARLDPLVGDSLRAIGYDTFLRDSCRTLEALHSQSNAPCAQIEASPLRHHCESTVAMALGKPDDCPFRIEGVKSEGRNPFCVAVAARDSRLCGAAEPESARCEAVLAHEPRLCPRSHAESDTCRRDVQRLSGSIGDAVMPKQIRPPPQMVLTIKGENGTADPSPPGADQSVDASRGVVIVKAHDRLVVELGRLGNADVGPVPTRARAAMRVSAQGPGAGALEKLEVDVPSAATVFFPGNHVEGTVKVDALEAKRGAPVTLVFDGHVTLGTRAFAVTISIATFVRDVVSDDAATRLDKGAALPAPRDQ
jgi:hypothetical protein